MKIFLLILFFFSTNGWASSIEYTKDSLIKAGSSTSNLNELLVEGAKSSTSTEGSPKVYIPFYDTKVSINGEERSNVEFSLFTPVDPSTSTAYHVIPSYSAKSPNDQSVVRHEFTIQINNADIFLFVAQVVDNKIYVLNNKIQGEPITKFEYTGVRRTISTIVDLRVLDLCGSLSSSNIPPCQGLDYNEDSFQPVTKSSFIYFFLVEGSGNGTPNISGNPEVKEYPDGIFFNYILSNAVISSPPIIDSVAKGDSRIKVNYSAGTGIAELKDVYAIRYPSEVTATYPQLTYYESRLQGGQIASDENGASNSGSLVVKDLANGEEAIVGLAYVNKFYFLSEISETESQTPEKIQTFLEEKECYLLSAGFQKDHYVLEYFREIRDNFLIKNIFGRDFVKWYYRTAPYYAGIIYENSILRLLVRSLGYMAYFTIRFLPILLAFLLIIFTFRRFKLNRG